MIQVLASMCSLPCNGVGTVLGYQLRVLCPDTESKRCVLITGVGYLGN